LQPENWQAAEFSERFAALEQLEHTLAREEGRPPCSIQNAEMESHECGAFSESKGARLPDGELNPGEPHVIQINDSLIENNDPRAAVETIAHEGRHCYQVDSVRNPELHPEVSAETRQIWEENLIPENYVKPSDDYAAYKDQPVEVDARSHAESVTSSIYTSEEKAPIAESATAQDISGAGVDSKPWQGEDLGEGVDSTLSSTTQPTEETEQQSVGPATPVVEEPHMIPSASPFNDDLGTGVDEVLEEPPPPPPPPEEGRGMSM
jgi:hypothetical protein